MSRRDEPFLMTPYSLLKVPEYGRFFDGAAVGFLYRYLRTGIRRQGTSQLKFQSSTGYITRLASLYDKGWLTSYATMDMLVEATGFTKKSLSSYISKLEEMKLIQRQEFGEGIIFVLGQRFILHTESGYGVGDKNEGFFMDEWESWLERDEKSFRQMLIQNLLPPAQAAKFSERLEEEFSHKEKNIPRDEENFSQNAPSDLSTLSPSALDNPSVEEPPRIDKVRIDTKTHAPLLPLDEAKEMVASIRSSSSDKEALALARQGYAKGIPLSTLNPVLAKRRDNMRWPHLPRFSIAFETHDRNPKNPHIEFARLWFALNEDKTGVVSGGTKSAYGAAAKYYQGTLLTQFSFDQCMWTLLRIINEGGKDLDFLASGSRTIGTLMKKHAAEYQDVLDARYRSRMEREAEKLREAREKEELEEIRSQVTDGSVVEKYRELFDEIDARAARDKAVKAQMEAWRREEKG